ncbi:cyclic pyranopterin phosphate synthase [Thermodesulfovibrio aggregans]|uniref:GTP 3',8-cyclase n=1 Tax=Thermodesulfovibrio aggregans TaxID=86166 RepID=A0A0U9HMI7_9BACT|nr:GTP 3',8-cyclase MoaA [Thermodesulfovibrio aggregans]GAQ94288.1 cyclic pyranopterin phosphate synthase [Thermodesulfovibrio aggregans]
MKDSFNRKIDYLRISVTDRCNLRCIYCMPEEGIKNLLPHDEILSYEEILQIIKVATTIGISKIRITGGEPLLRKNIESFIERVSRVDGIKDIGITTNGVLLKKYAKVLHEAGLKRVNVSLDSLDQNKFRNITRLGSLKEVLEGIEEAQRVGLNPVKINVVVMRGINDDEIEKFAMWSMEVPYQIRFIEFMPIGHNNWKKELFISTEEIKNKIESTVGSLMPVQIKKSGPAEYFMLEGAKGLIGFISPLSTHICVRCNRLRLTPEGKLRLCLFSDKEIDLKGALRGGASEDEIRQILIKAVQLKPQRASQPKPLRPMSAIGG